MAKILVVDDNKLLRRLLSDIIRSYGHEVIEAKDGKEGLDAVLQEHPDLAVVDFYMPRMNGADMLKAIRAAGGSVAQTPIIGLAGSYDAERRLREAGVTAYLSKPLHESELMDALNQVLGPPTKVA